MPVIAFSVAAVEALLARARETVGVQASSAGNVAAVTKVDALRAAAWRVLVDGRAKRKGQFTVREVGVS